VSDDALHAVVTYCPADGLEHVVHVPGEPIELYVPALNPDRYCPVEHVDFVPNCVSADGVHTPVTYCVPEGDEHAVHVPADPAALDVPALNPDRY